MDSAHSEEQPSRTAPHRPTVINIQVPGKPLGLAALALLVLWAIFFLWEIVVVIAASFIFMAAALPYVDYLVRHGLHRVAAVLVIFGAVGLVLVATVALVVPALIDETINIHDSLPEYGRRVDVQLAKYDIDAGMERRAEELRWGELLSGRAAVDFGQRVFFGLLAMVTILVITAYLLIDAPRLSAFVYQFVSPGSEPAVQNFLDSLRVVVGGYIRGQVITSLVIAVFTAGVMFAAGLPNALAFGLLAAFADIIPLVGATLAIAPAVLIALDDSVTKATIVLVALLAYQQFEDRFLTPRVYGSTLNLPPIIVLVTVLIGGKIFGVSGVLLALPAAAAGRVVLDLYLRRRARRTGGHHRAEEELFAPDTPSPSNTTHRGISEQKL